MFYKTMHILWVGLISVFSQAGIGLKYTDSQKRDLPHYLYGETTLAITHLEPGKMYRVVIYNPRGEVLVDVDNPSSLDGVLTTAAVLDALDRVGLAQQQIGLHNPSLVEFDHFVIQLYQEQSLVYTNVIVAGQAWWDPSTLHTQDAIAGLDYCAETNDDGTCASRGRLRYPANGANEWEEGVKRPLVILAHGNRYQYDWYNYLIDHLAYNGFIVVSVESTEHVDIPDRERNIFAHISYMTQHYGARLNGHLALIGHSRGGEAVQNVANAIDANPTNYDVDVKAVVTMAPSSWGGHVHLNGSAADGLLILYGSLDEDVHGDIFFQEVCESPFRTYDRAGSEESNYGSAPSFDKAMVFLYGGDHAQFSEGSAPAEINTYHIFGYMDRASQQLITQGYVNAFLRWHLLGHHSDRYYFREKWVPYAVTQKAYNRNDQYGLGSGQPLRLYSQYQPNFRHVIDNFENGSAHTNTMGGRVSTNDYAWFSTGLTFDLEDWSPHDTGGSHISWSRTTDITPYVQWEIPTGWQRDVSSYSHLSFRVGQINSHSLNTVSEDRDFHIRLTSGQTWQEVPLSHFGALPYPDKGQGINPELPADFSKSAMNTVNIPLAVFSDVDLRAVDGIYFVFDQTSPSGMTSGSIMVDSLQFIK